MKIILTLVGLLTTSAVMAEGPHLTSSRRPKIIAKALSSPAGFVKVKLNPDSRELTNKLGLAVKNPADMEGDPAANVAFILKAFQFKVVEGVCSNLRVGESPVIVGSTLYGEASSHNSALQIPDLSVQKGEWLVYLKEVVAAADLGSNSSSFRHIKTLQKKKILRKVFVIASPESVLEAAKIEDPQSLIPQVSKAEISDLKSVCSSVQKQRSRRKAKGAGAANTRFAVPGLKTTLGSEVLNEINNGNLAGS